MVFKLQMANFRFVPVKHQLLFVNCFCFLDSALLSWIKHSDGIQWNHRLTTPESLVGAAGWDGIINDVMWCDVGVVSERKPPSNVNSCSKQSIDSPLLLIAHSSLYFFIVECMVSVLIRISSREPNFVPSWICFFPSPDLHKLPALSCIVIAYLWLRFITSILCLEES